MKVDFTINGLKCDNPKCNYVNKTIAFEDYPKYIDYPCPICGQSLLTPKAYKMCVKMKNIGCFLTKITGGQKGNSKIEIPIK